MTLGDRLKKARTNKGLTLEEAGNLIGTTKQNIYKYENGIITNVPSDKIEALAKIYEVSPSFLMGWQLPRRVNRSQGCDEEGEYQSYYLDPEVAELANEIHKNPDMRILFDASKKLTKEDLQFVMDMVNRMKRDEGH